MKDKVKFAVIADFHQSMFPDSDEKIKQFIEAVNNDKEIEFVVDLGDLCFPIAKKNAKPNNAPVCAIAKNDAPFRDSSRGGGKK